ncbi:MULTISPECIES: ComEC/Rec2 family competence protein [Microbacterium]|uniref:ComEC/Rec2 family competence protein n=1 Tax=Microbacterium TaxID=33882 RepID=UPI00217D127D|nr:MULTISPECIES: ComEC/Rec2 family competence protein [Microbacterium]UWF76676.1 ComEC/Rec2 family competence protein [Microbacterium neungamense]WCM54826.1 ComEC/Rec2 family competence protein [Microbacterium sp. EF45047]
MSAGRAETDAGRRRLLGTQGLDLRSTVLAAAVWGVALACVLAPAAAPPLAIGCGALAAGWVLAAPWRRGLVALVLLGCAAAAVSVTLAQPAREAVARFDGRVTEITAVVTSSASFGRDGRVWFDAQTLRAGPPARASPVSAPVRVGVDPQPGIELGATVRVVAETAAADPGERAALILFGSEAHVVRPASGVFGVAAGVRADFLERARGLPPPGAALLPGLAVGDTRAVGEELNAAMRASGLSHLTAVSGANCAIVVAAVFWLVALCGGARWLRVVLALGALGAFIVLVTPEPSVVRAGVMAALAMLSILLGRPSAGLGMLSLAVTVILVADPWLAATPGFALSAAATAALLLLAGPLMDGLRRWMPEPLALALSVPVAAQLVCGPIIALFSEEQSLVGVAANLLAAPAAPVATVIGLLACLAGAVPPIADLLAAAAWLPASWIAATAITTAALPGATFAVPPGPVTALLVAAVSAAVCGVLLRHGLDRLRAASALVLVTVLALGGARMLLTGPLAGMTAPDGWSVAACDVGQGDALVIRSADRVALIDTGPAPEPLSACLSALGIARIDVLVLTHFDLDHAGGVDAVRGRVGAVLHGPFGSADDERLIAGLTAAGAVATHGAAGMSGTLGEASWRVLWPVRDSRAFPPGNDASVVVEIGGGEVPRTLLLGDLSASPQRMLLSSGRLRGPYDIVKVAHHGSADQEPALYQEARGRVALFSAGAGNDYGHPRAEALATAASLGSRVLRTDLQGRILLALEDGALAVWAERQAEQHPSPTPVPGGG